MVQINLGIFRAVKQCQEQEIFQLSKIERKEWINNGL